MYTSPLKDGYSLLFTCAKVFITDSGLSNENEKGLILSDDHYIGALSNIQLNIQKKRIDEYTFINGVKVLKKKKLIEVNGNIIISLVEMNKKNMENMLELISIDNKQRIEIVAMYPNKINRIAGIFPCTQLSGEENNIPLLSADKPISTDFKFDLLSPPSSNWGNFIYGNINIS